MYFLINVIDFAFFLNIMDTVSVNETIYSYSQSNMWYTFNLEKNFYHLPFEYLENQLQFDSNLNTHLIKHFTEFTNSISGSIECTSYTYRTKEGTIRTLHDPKDLYDKLYKHEFEYLWSQQAIVLQNDTLILVKKDLLDLVYRDRHYKFAYDIKTYGNYFVYFVIGCLFLADFLTLIGFF